MFEQKYEKYQNFLSENFQFLVVKFSVYLNRRVFVMSILRNVLRATQTQNNLGFPFALSEQDFCCPFEKNRSFIAELFKWPSYYIAEIGLQ